MFRENLEICISGWRKFQISNMSSSGLSTVEMSNVYFSLKFHVESLIYVEAKQNAKFQYLQNS